MSLCVIKYLPYCVLIFFMSDSLMFCSHNGVIACYFNNTLNLCHPFSKALDFFVDI